MSYNATVDSVDIIENDKGGYYKLSVTKEDGTKANPVVFPSSESLAAKVADLEAGQKVSLTFSKNAKGTWELKDVGAPQAQKAFTGGSYGGAKKSYGGGFKADNVGMRVGNLTTNAVNLLVAGKTAADVDKLLMPLIDKIIELQDKLQKILETGDKVSAVEAEKPAVKSLVRPKAKAAKKEPVGYKDLEDDVEWE